jgi:hypothetical protein
MKCVNQEKNSNYLYIIKIMDKKESKGVYVKIMGK